MSTFDESKVRRGQPDNAGQFRDHVRTDPDTVLEHDGRVDLAPSDALGAATCRFLEARAVYERETIRDMRRIAPAGMDSIAYSWDGDDLQFAGFRDEHGNAVTPDDVDARIRDAYYDLGNRLGTGALRHMHQNGPNFTLDVEEPNKPTGIVASRRRLQEAIDRHRHVGAEHEDWVSAANEVEDAAHDILTELSRSAGIRRLQLDWSDQGEFMTVTEVVDADGTTLWPGNGVFAGDLEDELDEVASNIANPSRNFMSSEGNGATFILDISQEEGPRGG